MDYEIVLSALSSKAEEFENLKNKLNNSIDEETKPINKVNNTEIQKLYNNLQGSLDRLKQGYQKCDTWLSNYIEGLEELELSLSNFSNNNIEKPKEFNGEFIDLFGKKNNGKIKNRSRRCY